MEAISTGDLVLIRTALRRMTDRTLEPHVVLLLARVDAELARRGR